MALLSVAAAQQECSLCLTTAYNLFIIMKTHKQTEFKHFIRKFPILSSGS